VAKTMIFGRRCIMAAGCKAPPLLLLALALAQVSSGRGAPTLAPSPPNPECLGRYPPPSCPPPPLPPPLPTPPRQTPAQRKLIEHVEKKAEAASKLAKPAVLEWLGSQDFLDELDGCCAEIHQMSPKQRLDWIDAEFVATEM
jgi:hypothetical protein